MASSRAQLQLLGVVLTLLLSLGCGRGQAGPAGDAERPAGPTAVATVEAAPTIQAAPPAAEDSQPASGPVASADRVESGAQPAPGQPLPPEVLASYKEIEQAMARIRGLQPARDIELRQMTAADLGQYLRRSFDREYTPEERARDQKLLSILGLIEPDRDLTALMLGLLTSEVIGMYDETDRRLYLIAASAQPSPSTKVTFAHEFTHALQDQTFGLRQLDPPPGQDDDRAAAVQAMVEGDATVAMSVFAREELSARERRQYQQDQQRPGPNPLEDAPLVVREQLIFPYREGADFVLALQRRGGFAAVDAAYRNPPRSTEQIIHPDKYLAGEAPVEVALPDLAAALGGGWRQTDGSTLGELDVRVLVQQFTDRSTAERAAAGWGGGRYALLQDGERAAVVFRTTWDSAQDAREFFDAYRRALRSRFGARGQVLADASDRQALAGDGLAALVTIQGQAVAVTLAPDEAIMNQLDQALAGS